MNKVQMYFKDMLIWRQQWNAYLLDEPISERKGLSAQFEEFDTIIEGIHQPESMTNDELENLQRQVEQLHQSMEEYVSNREPLGEIVLNQSKVTIGGHRLPPLPYSFDSLEPIISEEIMKLHYLKHHQSYVDGLNKAEKKLEEARTNNDYSLIKHWSRELAFHGSGHYLHTIFWNNMSPNGGGKPSGELMKALKEYFGEFEAFKNQFTEAAKAVEGVGWAILVWSPRSHHLEILQSERHMLLTQWDTIPLLVLDVWEHAYYLQYKNERAQYVNNWWNIVNWKNVEERFDKAKQLKWKAY